MVTETWAIADSSLSLSSAPRGYFRQVVTVNDSFRNSSGTGLPSFVVCDLQCGSTGIDEGATLRSDSSDKSVAPLGGLVRGRS